MKVSLWTVDPGGFTGWCWAPVDTDVMSRVDGIALLRDRTRRPDGVVNIRGAPAAGWCAGTIKVGGATGFLQFARMVASSKGATARYFECEVGSVRTIIVPEGFQLLAGSGVKSQSVQLPVKWLGMLDLYRAIYPEWCDAVEPQLPAEKGVITDDRLRRWGLWFPQKDTRDAIRHMCVKVRKFLELG